MIFSLQEKKIQFMNENSFFHYAIEKLDLDSQVIEMNDFMIDRLY